MNDEITNEVRLAMLESLTAVLAHTAGIADDFLSSNAAFIAGLRAKGVPEEAFKLEALLRVLKERQQA